MLNVPNFSYQQNDILKGSNVTLKNGVMAAEKLLQG